VSQDPARLARLFEEADAIQKAGGVVAVEAAGARQEVEVPPVMGDKAVCTFSRAVSRRKMLVI